MVSAAAVLVFGLALVSSGTVRVREDWNGATATLAHSVRPGDVILHCASWKYPAFRHAVRLPGGVPNIVLLDWRMIRFDDAGQSNSEWERAYFRSMLEPPMRYLMGQKARLPIRKGAMSPFRRAWFVESECDANAFAKSRDWLGEGRYTLAGSSPSTKHHAGIKIYLFEPASAVSRQVYSVTN